VRHSPIFCTIAFICKIRSTPQCM